MGLIQCQECGKTISDTIKICIHCGAPLRDAVEDPPAVPVCEQENSSTHTSFDALPIAEQDALEKEFLLKDKRALKFRRKRQGAKNTLILSGILALFFFYNLISYLALSSFFQNAKILNLSYILTFFSFICFFIGLIVGLKNKPTPENDVKKCIYYRKFQAFLKEKEIDYTPVFIVEKERLLFEQVDATMKL